MWGTLEECKMVVSPPERPPFSIELDSEAETPNERRFPHRVDTQQFDYVFLKDFISQILPQSYVVMFPDIDLVVERLKNNSALKHSPRWADFPLSCSEVDEPEAMLFARLSKIVAAISKAATAVATNANEADRAPPHLEYVNNGNMTPRTKRRLDTSRPDGLFVLKSRPMAASTPTRVRWCDIAAVAEFKNTKSDVANVDKVLWSLHHLMSDDICRDFVYGFTIENTSMKLWYCDRSNVVVSDEFDIHQDYKVFLIFCLSILYASKGELGWDTTIESEEPPKPQDNEQRGKPLLRDERASTNPTDPDASDKSRRYIINVRIDEQVTRRFIIISPISLRGAVGILGRGTRVWKARELIDGKEDTKVVAIKDYWIDDHRDREGQVVESILSAARDEAHHADLKSHIIDILCHGDVYREHINIGRRNGEQPVISKVMVKDSTRNLKDAIRRRDLAFKFNRPKVTQVSVPSDKDQVHVDPGDHTLVTPSTYLYLVQGEQRPLPGVRTRNRLVMTQVGKPLHAEDSLLAVFSGLKDACTGLKLIHECGWMHRDISTGNIILWEGKGIISDFEYAKRIPEKGEAASASHAERTGTLHFMAVEVQEGSYNFMPMEDDVALDLSRPDLSDQTRISAAAEPAIDKGKRRSSTANSSEPEEAPGESEHEFLQAVGETEGVTTSNVVFTYNPAHDFESLLWIAIYFILNRVVVGQPQQQFQNSLDAQTSYARLLFSGDVHARSRVFTNTDFADAIEWLHPKLYKIGGLVNKWIQVQRAVYKKVESGDLNTIVSSEDMLGISQNISPYLQQIVDILRSEDIKVKFLPTKTTMARST